MSEPINLFPF